MNCQLKYFLTFVIFYFSFVSLIAGDFEKESHINSENTVSSLLIGLKSENLGLRTSCAYMLGELKVKEAVIPLMKMLRDNVSEEERISAALALYKISTPLSINAVKQAGEFDESRRVSKLATNFYNQYLRNKISNDEEFNDSTYVSLK